MKRHVEHNNKNVAVHLLWAELEYDVKYGIAKRIKMSGVKGEEKKRFLYTDDDKDWLLRAIDTALGNVKSKLKCYLVNNSVIASDELLEQPMEYNLSFHFDDNVQWLGHPDNLMNAIHAYVANFCLADYFDMADMNVSAILHNKAEESLNQAYAELTSVILDETPKFIL